ncbi:DUF6318 family protein [Ruania zhangjianzhongii]|uniref:DUF6318 family protein n=1 Tax=Ruania zhangjianzhongii TaxID=2603206 RepID=UPI0011CB9308|nr:DUF6318 family protein [Ruania zhangjianzhongii]
MVSRRGRMLWALAGLLVLTGCTPAEGEETTTPTVSESPSESTEPATDDPTGDDDASGGDDPSEDPSEPPEVEAPERPAEMDEETVDGAIAAAKYFVNLYPYVYASGDLAEWDALSDEGCGFCTNVRDRASELHDEGGFSVGGDVDISSSDGGGPFEEDVYTVELAVTIGASEFVYPDGTRTPYSAVEDPEFLLSMRWESEGWLVLGVVAGDDS